MIKPKNVVEIGGKLYSRTASKGYWFLHPIVDGIVDKSWSVAEHRVVYENAHGVKLPDNFHVHHLNRDRKDNRPENLVALSVNDHKKLHAFEDRGTDIEKLCNAEKLRRDSAKLYRDQTVSAAVEKALSSLVAYGDKIYHVSKSNGYNVLYPLVDGKVDYSIKIPEHRLVYELANGVVLNPDQGITHINGIRDDNRPENLALVLPANTDKVNHEKRRKRNEQHCVDCGAPISINSTRCLSCAKKHRRAKGLDGLVSKDELEKLIETKSNVEIGGIYGVSDVSIKKLRERYGLPSSREQRSKNKKNGKH